MKKQKETNFLLPNDGNVYISGKNGTGKTHMITKTLLEKINKNECAICIDTEGIISDTILSTLEKKDLDKVIYLDFGNTEYIHGLNMIDTDNPELSAQIIINFFTSLYGGEIFGPRLQDYLYHAIMLLSEQDGNGKFFHLIRLFTDDAFANSKIRNIKNPIIFHWRNTIYQKMTEREKGEMIPFFQAKLTRLQHGQIGRLLNINQNDSISIEKLINEGKTIIIHIPEMQLGSIQTRFLSLILLFKIYTGFTAKYPLLPIGISPYTLFLDEGQIFISEIFADLLKISSKTNLQIVFAHRYLDQLKRNELGGKLEFWPYMSNYFNTHIFFRQNLLEANQYCETLYKEFLPSKDLLELQKYECLIYSTFDNSFYKKQINNTPTLCKNGSEKIKLIKKIYALKFGVERSIVNNELLATVNM